MSRVTTTENESTAMRLFSILTALVVAASLYMVVLERDVVMALAGNDIAAEAGDAVGDAPETPRISVVALASEARPIDTAVVTRGQTEAQRQVEVRAETSGRVISEPLRRGSFVETGDLLCRLDAGTRNVALAEAQARLAEAQARRPEAQARVAEAQAALAEARINQNAATSLSEGGYATQTRVASSDAAVESALAGVEAAKAGLESVSAGLQSAEAAVVAAETELERLEIHAPFAGLLETDTAELGTLLQPGSLCGTVIQLDPIKLVGFVPEISVDRIETGAGAMARLAGGREIAGRVSFLSRAADPETRTFRVEVEAPNDDLAIRDGQTAELMIASAGREAHLLPQSSLTLDDGGNLGVRVVGPDETARFRPVDVLRDTPEGVFVDGLDPAERVIVVGQEYVSDGVALDVTMREAAP